MSLHFFTIRALCPEPAQSELNTFCAQQMLVPSSFACRPGLGVHAAVQAVQGQLQRHAWWVQVDVAAYFAHLDHGILTDLLQRRFKGEGLLALLARTLAQGTARQPNPGVGLPIGALTSQHVANAYLDGADRFLLDHPGVRGHVRYMDDIVWWCDGPEAGARTLAALAEHLAQTRCLKLKPTSCQGSSIRRLAFCCNAPTMAWPPRWRTPSRCAIGRGCGPMRAPIPRPLAPRHLTTARRTWRRRWPTTGRRAKVPAVMRNTFVRRGPEASAPRGSRRQLDQRRAQRALGQPQRQPARRPQRQPGLSSGPELQGPPRMGAGWTPGGALDQMPHPARWHRAACPRPSPNRKAPGVLVAQKWVEARRANAPRAAASA